eukprot:TRINITY_DN2682_c0_g1_i6.p1 TRINITY_DN2682_c0_g1~~TRINITY_DN2682_c0_g1_i6.p1  ORF type:complete len:188 (+),score=37.84 TRINITY_DN2682_c0_g1_i6:620-1183(+)
MRGTPGFKDLTREYTAKQANRFEDRKVHFDQPRTFQDKKYEGYSLGGGTKEQTERGRKGTKGGQKGKKLDEEFIHNLHQHIYYLEMQLKLLKDKDIESKKGGLNALFRDGIPLNENFLALKNRYKKEHQDLDTQVIDLEREIAKFSSSNSDAAKKIEMIQEECEQLNKLTDKQSKLLNDKERRYFIK